MLSESALQKDLVVAAKAYTQDDCKRYLDRNIIAEGYRPVQLYIANNSDHDYLFALHNLSVTCVPAQEVAEKVHTSTIGRAVGYGVGSLFIPLLVIPAIVDGIGSSEANKRLDHDFLAKTASDQVIRSHGVLNKIVFIPTSEYQGVFTLTLVDQATNTTKKIQVTPN